MVKYYYLDKIQVANESKTMESDKFMLIKAIGTNDTDLTVKIAGKELTKINSTVAPLHKTSSNLLGPLKLGEMYLVVPPNKKLEFGYNTATSLVRLIGLIGELGPGEVMPAEHQARFNNQGQAYRTSDDDSVTTPTSFADGQELSFTTIEPSTIEKHVYNNIFMVDMSASGYTLTDDDVGVRFYIDGKPLDNLDSDMARWGIAYGSMPAPPADSTEEEPFTFRDMPIVIEPGHKLKITLVNVSGGALTAGAAGTAKYYVIYDYFVVK